MKGVLTDNDVLNQNTPTSTSAGTTLQNSVSVSEVDESVTTNHNKRKRDNSADSLHTCRPQNAKNTTPKKKLVKRGGVDEGSWTDVLDELNPIPLPEKVVILFMKRHQFPSQQNHEMLKGIGFPPKVFIATEGNRSSLISNYKDESTERIANRIRSRTRSTSIDREQSNHDLQTKSTTKQDTTLSSVDNPLVLKPHHSSVVVKPSGTIIVTFQDQVVEFPVCTVSVTRM